MKRVTTYLKLMMIALTASFLMTACEDDPAVPDAPIAFFSYEVDAENTQLIVFTNESDGGDTYSWDFGDQGSSTDVNPSHEYAAPGEYTVVLTATNEGGENKFSVAVNVMANAPVNLLVNGTLDDDSNWTVQQFNGNNNGSVTFAEGVVVINEILDIEEADGAGWGEAWAHAGIYQSIDLTAGTYIFDMDFITEGIEASWAEVWIGTTAPIADEEYNGDDGAVRIGLVNAWDCPGTSTYTGALSAGPECTPEAVELTETGTYYLVLRSGGFNFGPNGITVDNLSFMAN